MLRDGHERIVAQKRSFIAEQKAFIARVNAGCTEVRQQVAELQKKLDKLLDHCPDAECPVCSEIVWPHGDPMHFHHDGGPSCA